MISRRSDFETCVRKFVFDGIPMVKDVFDEVLEGVREPVERVAVFG